jgi:ribosomal protein S18 acetylase RimI-like enzyme
MEIIPSTIEDIDEIFRLYDLAVEYQKKVSDKHWLPFDRKLIEKEIAEQRQWKIVINNEIACIYAIAFEDPLIWGEKGKEPAIYIHRIVTNPDFRGNNFVVEIVKWAKEFAKSRGIGYIRMDTWGDNQKLIDYYVKCGFKFLGIITPAEVEKLPKHYEGITLSIFEIKID